MKKLKIAIASFLIANSFALAEGVTDFQTKAVKELYNKGILQSIVKEEDFSKKDNFSRGEIAAIIYNTLSLKNAETVKKATPEEITILKALVSDFSGELAKMGAKDYELLELINSQNKTINQRIDSEVAALNKKIDRINITGDFSLIKEINTKQTAANPRLMNDVKGEGEIALNLNLTDNVKGKIAYDLEKEQGEYSLNVNKDNLTLMAFNDESISSGDWADWGNEDRRNKEEVKSKKLPEFDNNLGIISKAGINNKDTIVLNKKMENQDFLALVTSTDDEDIYGVQYKRKMKYFMTGEGSDANMVVSYVGDDDKDTITNDKTFLTLGADFVFPISEKAKETIRYNYIKMRQDYLAGPATENNYYMPVVNDEANYLYSKTNVDSQKYGKVDVVLGAVNTGYNFDASNLADGEKELFAETESQNLIKLDSNIFGGLAIVKNTKGAFENTISSISYKKNDSSEDDTTIRVDTLYSLKNGKLKLGLGAGQNTTTVINDSSYKRVFVEGQIHLKDVVSGNTANLIKVKVAKEENHDKNELVAYIDHKKTLNNSSVVLASQYENSAEENTLKAAVYYDKKGKFSDKYTGDMLFGGRYDKDYDETSGSERYRLFTKFDVNLKENVTLEGGARYGKSSSTSNDTNFAAGVTYKLTGNVKTSLVYGRLAVLDDYTSNIFKYDNDVVYEDNKNWDKDLVSVKISCKF